MAAASPAIPSSLEWGQATAVVAGDAGQRVGVVMCSVLFPQRGRTGRGGSSEAEPEAQNRLAHGKRRHAGRNVGRRHGNAAGMEPWRARCSRSPASGCAEGAPQGRARIHAAGAPRPHPSGDRARQRGVPQAGRPDPSDVEEPDSLHRGRRPAHATNPRRSRPRARGEKARRTGSETDADARHRGAGGKDCRPRRSRSGAREAGGSRAAAGPTPSSCASSAA